MLVINCFTVLCIVFGLQLCDLLRLLTGLLNLLQGSHFFLLEHPNPVPELFDITLDLKSDGPRLVVSQVFTFNVNHDVLRTTRAL